MKFGFIPTEGGPFIKNLLKKSCWAIAGLDSVWLEEHHGVTTTTAFTYGLAGVTQTEHIMLGTDI
jgi:hypothetical protein